MKNLNRRQFLNVIAGGAAAATLPGCATGRSKSANAKPKLPNIIFIMADDMGYADLGCYGQRHIKTPNIDQLAEEGTRFTQCYTGSTVCAPSRSVLMTGQHTGHTRVRGNKGRVGGVGSERRVPLQPQDITVAEVLKKAGYSTGITGKWGLGEPETTGVPNRQGFDEWFGYLNQAKAHSYYPPYLWKNEQKFILEGNQNGQRKQYSHDLMTDFALDFVRRHKSGPFFLYVPYTIPHAKYEIPSTDPYTNESWPKDAKVHAAMITLMDRDVGRIMSLLKDLWIDDQTLVFFCSDNGAAKRWEGIFDSSGPLRGRKRDMYEGGIRTPMIARWPAKVPADRVNRTTVWYFADLLPTLADLAGVQPPADIDGISILPAILGKKQTTDNRFLYWEFYESGFKQAVRWRNYKAVRPAIEKPIELYDLDKDLAETTNIAAQNPKIVAKFENYLKTARTESPNWPVK
ncbi:MAG: sulfatase-like hydrolase/transferase [Planctomycetes bacterium]|nr:sulfatase-like hydrolase/transferase [Planctomycetota bacterium]